MGPLSGRLYRRGFTLIEVLLSIVILVLLAAILVPSFVGMDRRNAQLAIDELEDLMTMYAYRDTMGGQPVALWHDAETSEIMLLVLELNEEIAGAKAEWVTDRFSQPVVLPEDVEIREMLVDQRRENPYDWIVTRAPGRPRPSVVMDLRGPGDLAVTLSIAPTSLSATRTELGQPASALRQTIDLDAIGADRERW